MMPELLGRTAMAKALSLSLALWGAADVSQTVGEFLQSVRLHTGQAEAAADWRGHAGFEPCLG